MPDKITTLYTTEELLSWLAWQAARGGYKSRSALINDVLYNYAENVTANDKTAPNPGPRPEIFRKVEPA
jgi:hypothetical protein